MMNHRRARSSGFSLLELLLATGVFFTLLVAILILLQTFGERELGRATNKYMTTVAESMTQILSNIDNYNAMYKEAVARNGAYQLIADNTMPAQDNITKTFVVQSVTIQASRLFNDQFRGDLPIRGKVRILLRVADDPTVATDTPALDIIIINSEPRPDGLVRRAAIEEGPNGGFIEGYGSKADAFIKSAFGTWRIDPARLQNTDWYINELRPTLNSKTEGLYLVYYMFQSIEDVGGDYLYRVRDVDATLNRNTMFGDFNIGGNDIYGGDDINIGNDSTARPLSATDPRFAGNAGLTADCTNNVLCVNGTGVIKGSASIGGTLTTTGSALIADSAKTNKIRIQNGLSDADKQTYNAQSQFVVDGNGNDGGGVQDQIDVSGNANFSDGATVGNANLQTTNNMTLTMPDIGGSGILTADTIDARRISATTVNSRTVTVDNQLRTGIVQRGDINVLNGPTGTIDINASRDMVFGAPGRDRVVSVPNLNIGTMNISTFGTCQDGCQQ